MMFRFSVCMALSAFTLTGCGGSGPNVIPVGGLVTLDGKPLAHKSLIFVPIDGTGGHGSGCVSDAEGKYTLVAMVPGAVKEYAGIIPGHYRVTVKEPMFPVDTSVNEEDLGIMAISPQSQGKSIIPRIYGTDRSPLIFEIPESGGVIDVKLSSK